MINKFKLLKMTTPEYFGVRTLGIQNFT